MNLLKQAILISTWEVVKALIWVIYAGVAVFFIGYSAVHNQWWFMFIPLLQILLAVVHFIYGMLKDKQECEQAKTKPMTAKEHLEANNIEDRYVYRTYSDWPKAKLSETLEDFVEQRNKTNEQQTNNQTKP